MSKLGVSAALGLCALAVPIAFAEAQAPTCASLRIKVLRDAPISAATGQNPVAVALTNRSARTCVLEGYPTVSLLDARGERIPFPISHRGDQMVTARRPARVRIRPGRSGFFLLNKYRCDLGNVKLARKLRVAVPGGPEPLTLELPRSPIIAYCRGGRAVSTVTVSPIEPTLAATLAYG